MVLTISFIADNFSKFNKEYFEGKLKTPTFEITHVKSYLGQYHWKYDKFNYTYDGRRTIIESVIRISDRYDRNETEYRQTILHSICFVGKPLQCRYSRHNMVYMSGWLILMVNVSLQVL